MTGSYVPSWATPAYSFTSALSLTAFVPEYTSAGVVVMEPPCQLSQYSRSVDDSNPGLSNIFELGAGVQVTE
ncbi:MAG: hypothetical protein IPF52_19690 [Saprospiraceae bacterium]|nr:hypothetical protein [Saprospiraceae bacterium]